MRNQRATQILVTAISLMLVFLAGCASVQESWNKLTPQEKSRVVISDVQAQLNTMFDTGKSYISTHPEQQAIWKEKIVPAIDAANTTLKGVMELSLEGTLDPSMVYQKMQPALDKVRTLLVQIGAIKP